MHSAMMGASWQRAAGRCGLGLGRSLLTVLMYAACLRQCVTCLLSTGRLGLTCTCTIRQALIWFTRLNTPVRRAMIAADAWDEIRHWGRLWGEPFKVHWQRGHPDRRHPDSTRWTVLKAANHVADGLVDVERDSTGGDMGGTFEFGCQWRV